MLPTRDRCAPPGFEANQFRNSAHGGGLSRVSNGIQLQLQVHLRNFYLISLFNLNINFELDLELQLERTSGFFCRRRRKCKRQTGHWRGGRERRGRDAGASHGVFDRGGGRELLHHQLKTRIERQKRKGFEIVVVLFLHFFSFFEKLLCCFVPDFVFLTLVLPTVFVFTCFGTLFCSCVVFYFNISLFPPASSSYL